MQPKFKKQEGEYRYIDVVDGWFVIKHAFNELLKNRLKRLALNGIRYEPDAIKGGKWFCLTTLKNTCKLIKFAAENDYDLYPGCRLEFEKSLAKLAAWAKTAEGSKKVKKIMENASIVTAPPATPRNDNHNDTDQMIDSSSPLVPPPLPS